MAKPLVDDELWALIEPILPAPKPRHFRYPGRLPLVQPRGAQRDHFCAQDGHPLD